MEAPMQLPSELEALAIRLISHLESGKVIFSEHPSGMHPQMLDMDSEPLFKYVRKGEYKYAMGGRQRPPVKLKIKEAHCIYFSNGWIWDSEVGFRKQGWKDVSEKADYVSIQK